ncbi:hypothetical protein RHGRI_000083 [Rhododendron griersonianum]|uniref:Uncharacterized protein n=1 Tax=Rhododendron griersonianum TaxID=479676 RepID=A0AAV6LG40_9ERIC|nr:hypothetical protein RHGRI_000083 [Rhododendron griersonianum]
MATSFFSDADDLCEEHPEDLEKYASLNAVQEWRELLAPLVQISLLQCTSFTRKVPDMQMFRLEVPKSAYGGTQVFVDDGAMNSLTLL